MPTTERAIEIYLRLARSCDGPDRAGERDGYLLLAAEAAWACGRNDQAERLRFLLLKHNPNHLLKAYGSFAQALESQDVPALIRQLRRQHPVDKAEQALQALEPEGDSARRDTPRAGDPTKQELVLPLRPAAGEEQEPVRASVPKPAAPPAAVRVPPQKEVSPMADTNQPRPIPDPRRPAPPVARPAAPNIFNVAPDDRPRPRAAVAPIAGLSPPRHEASGSGALGVLLAIIVLAVGAALFLLTFVHPFVPLF